MTVTCLLILYVGHLTKILIVAVFFTYVVKTNYMFYGTYIFYAVKVSHMET